MFSFGAILTVPKGPFLHERIYVGLGMVFPCHPDTGERFVSINELANGKEITATAGKVLERGAALQRLHRKLSNPQPHTTNFSITANM